MPSTRRDLLSGAAALGATGLAGCAALDEDREPDLSGDWPQVGRDAANANHAPHATLPAAVGVAWRHRIGGWPYVQPVIAEGTVYAAGDHGVFALAAADGAPRWPEPVDLLPSGGLALTDGAVLVPHDPPTRTEDPPALVALDRATGTELWRVELEARGFAPSVADGAAYLRTDAAALAVDLDGDADGPERVRWRRPLEPLRYDEYNAVGDDMTTLIAPAVDRDRVYLPDDGTLLALDRASGEPRWREPLEAAMASPVADEGGVVATGIGGTVALEPDGERRWRIDRGSWTSVAAAEETVYVADSSLTAHDASDGSRRWTADGGTGIQVSQPAVVGDTVAAAGGEVVVNRRGDPGRFADRELLTIREEGGHLAAHGGLAVGGGRLLAVDGIAGAVVAYEPAP
ncbi:PQQ-binding-like beta-propeller repeat protein [Haloparvum alkalitolerans]|uniref:outer membrane protein assembly factor BamB family protein n=1 Tax=Haloparvum alkalitolerans TaxID=1042953 RepID=UPI003CEA2579